MTTKKSPKTKKVVRGWTLEDVVHFIIFRELDKLGVLLPYRGATQICNELRAAVQYRTLPTKKSAGKVGKRV